MSKKKTSPPNRRVGRNPRVRGAPKSMWIEIEVEKLDERSCLQKRAERQEGVASVEITAFASWKLTLDKRPSSLLKSWREDVVSAGRSSERRRNGETAHRMVFEPGRIHVSFFH